jgi:photosynthetic reaction center cytochrome c subunit
MKRESGRIVVVIAAIACLLGAALAVGHAAPQGAGQAAAEQTPMSDKYFKNVQLLRGIPVDEFMDTMGMFAAATGMNCVDCHVAESDGNWPKYAEDNDYKRTTRMMIVMMNTLNTSYFGGRRVLTCYSCHNGGRRPRTLPNLVTQYAVAPPAEPDEIEKPFPNAPAPDQVLDKYIQAVGGAQRVAALTSLTGKGTYRNFDDFDTSPFDVIAKAPNQRVEIRHTAYGDFTTTYDGRNAWQAAPQEFKPFGVVAFTGGNLQGAAVDAKLIFPGRLKQAFTNWVSGPPTVIDDHDVQIVQGNSAPGFPVKLYFDTTSGLLLRSVRYSDSLVGRVPVQVDYSDYRDVSGVKVPFKWISTWTDGRTVFEFSSVQVNTAVDAAKFAKPAVPTPPAAAK